MTGADGTYDYKAMAAGIVLAGGEGMGNLLPVVEKELLHYRILDAMMREGFFSSLVFHGGTSLRLCHGSPRYSEDLDFAGGTSFDMDTLKGLGSCISDSLSGMGDDVTVRVKEPRPDADGLTRRWRKHHISLHDQAGRNVLFFHGIKIVKAAIKHHLNIFLAGTVVQLNKAKILRCPYRANPTGNGNMLFLHGAVYLFYKIRFHFNTSFCICIRYYTPKTRDLSNH